MKRAQVALLGLGMVVVMLGVGGLTYYTVFYRHKGALTQELATLQDGIVRYQDWLDSRPPVQEKLNGFAGATLGFDAEVVESRLRSGLNRMAASAGLVRDDTVVSARPVPTPVPNPAVAQKQPVAEFRRFARDERIAAPDFYVMEAEIRGSGTLEAAVRLLALAQTQPWIWSVRNFTLTPQGNQSVMFDISVGVTTAVLPDLGPQEARAEGVERPEVEPPPIMDPDAKHLLATTAIVRRNVFVPPPPPPKTEPEVRVAEAAPSTQEQRPEPKPGPPPPPYHEWRLTGVSGSPGQGALAWMLNVRTGAAVMLSPGEGVLDATLVAADLERAVFQIGEARFSLALNETLAERHPVE